MTNGLSFALGSQPLEPGQSACKGANQKLWSNWASRKIRSCAKEAFSEKGGRKGATCIAGRFGQKLEIFESNTDGGIWKGHSIPEGIATKKVAKRVGRGVVARLNKDMLKLDQ